MLWISVSNSVIMIVKEESMHTISSIFLQFRTVQCSMNQKGILWKHRVKFLCNFISAFFRYFSERFAYATILLNAHKSCENWTVYAICSLARTSFRKSFLETRLSPIICYIFFGTKQRKIDTKVQSNSSVMLKRGTWNFKKNAKRPFLWQRSAGNQDRCSDHFLRTLIFKLEGWKVFDNNGLGVKIHWKCWILWTSHFTCKISMNLTYFYGKLSWPNFICSNTIDFTKIQ